LPPCGRDRPGGHWVGPHLVAALQANLEAGAERPAEVALLFFCRQLPAYLEGRVAGDRAQPADPAARPFLRYEGEGIAILERGDRRAQRSADELAPPGLDLEARPAVIFVRTAKIEAHRNGAGHCQLVAASAKHGEIEGVAAAG